MRWLSKHKHCIKRGKDKERERRYWEKTKATAVDTGWKTDARISEDRRNAAENTKCKSLES